MRESIALAILGLQLTIAGTFLYLADRDPGEALIYVGIAVGVVAAWTSLADLGRSTRDKVRDTFDPSRLHDK